MKLNLILSVALAAGLLAGCGAVESSQPFTASFLDVEVGGQARCRACEPAPD